MTDSEKRTRIDELYRGYRKDFPDVQDIEPQEAMRLLQEGRALFIDVREPNGAGGVHAAVRDHRRRSF